MVDHITMIWMSWIKKMIEVLLYIVFAYTFYNLAKELERDIFK